MTEAAKTGIEAERVPQIACAGCRKLLDVSYLPSFSQVKCPECGLSQIVPARFGGFLLVGKLGAGGMGVIYHAVDKELGRHVALKVMKKELGENAEFVQSFKHEAQAAATLNHPNVVQIYSFGQVAGQPYIAMELVSGGRLDEMIGEGKILEEARALEIHLQVVAGLLAASEVGLVHGDIKPANVLFGQNGEAKVVDFGLASFIGQQQQGAPVWGTPYYIAPEKARGQRVDFRSDIYSLGATLFHALAGQPPFEGATPLDVVMARLEHPAPSLLDYNPDLHPETVAMVARMLEVEPTMRHPSYPALQIDMEAAREAAWQPLKTATVRKTRLVARPQQTQPDNLKQKLRIRLAIAFGAVVLVGAGIFFWHAHQQQQLRRAAAAEQRQKREAALTQGEIIFGRINTLAALITQLDEGLQPLAERIKKQTAASSNLNEAVEKATVEIDTAFEMVDETSDTQAQAVLARERLQASTNYLAAEEAARQLQDCHNSLIKAYNLIQDHQAEASNALAKAGTVRAQLATAERQARAAAAEEAARKKAEEEAKLKEQQQAAEAAKARGKLIQVELDLVDQARGGNAALIAQRKFEEAAANLTRIKTNLAQPEGKDYLQNVADAYEAINRLKSFVINSIQQAPYPNGWTTGVTPRDIIKASAADGLTIALGPAGSVIIPWDQVTTTHFARIANHYLASAQLADGARAELVLALALLCYESGVFKTAETFAAQATQLNPALKSEVQRLMPGFDEE